MSTPAPEEHQDVLGIDEAGLTNETAIELVARLHLRNALDPPALQIAPLLDLIMMVPAEKVAVMWAMAIHRLADQRVHGRGE